MIPRLNVLSTPGKNSKSSSLRETPFTSTAVRTQDCGVGMNLDIRNAQSPAQNSNGADNENAPIAAARIVGVARTSAIVEVGASKGELRIGDQADLIPQDAATARLNALAGPENTLDASSKPVADDPDPSSGLAAKTLRSAPMPDDVSGTRTVGRIGFDTSGISSTGSTPGTSLQLGMSFQSNITHILGSHWNLEGYWRGRLNRHSQFQEPTIEDSLNKTYTMQLYYDNPNSKWAAGMGRLYLPWAVSLDTVDGGYLRAQAVFRKHNRSVRRINSRSELVALPAESEDRRHVH